MRILLSGKAKQANLLTLRPHSSQFPLPLEQADGSTKKKKEYLWGYGSGVAAATIGGYGDVVIAEHTLPFNEGDITYYLPLYNQAVSNLDFFPTYVPADAAYDAWYVYQTCAFHGGIAAVPLNEHGHENARYDKDGTPLCEKGLRMYPTIQFKPDFWVSCSTFCLSSSLSS